MNALLAAMILAPAAFQTQESHFTEVPIASEDKITVQALVRTYEFNPDEQTAVQVLVGAMRDGSSDYSRPTMRRNSAPGYEPQFVLMPDHIRVSVTVDKGELSTGLGMIVSLLRDPLLNQEAIDAAVAEASKPADTAFQLALRPDIHDFRKLKRDQLVDLHRYLFQPANTYVVVMGAFDPGKAEQEWNERTKDWKDRRVAKRNYYGKPPTMRTTSTEQVTTAELFGPNIKPSDADFPTKLLALYALGVGKGSSLHRVVRDREALSYRQEAILWPSPNGFRARFLLAAIPSDQDAALPEKMRNLLAEDIRNWTKTDLDRALGMATASLIEGIGPNPLYWGDGGPLGKDLPDRAFLMAYWQMKAGKIWDPLVLVDDLRKVGLDDLKNGGESLILTAMPRVISGKK